MECSCFSKQYYTITDAAVFFFKCSNIIPGMFSKPLIPIGQVLMPLLFLILREGINEGVQTIARTPTSNSPQMVCTLKHPGVVAVNHATRKTTPFESPSNDKYVRTAA